MAGNPLPKARHRLPGAGMTHLQCASAGAVIGIALFIYTVGPR